MAIDTITLKTPLSLEDAKRQLHLAVVFLCGRKYLANGTITLSTPVLEGPASPGSKIPGLVSTTIHHKQPVGTGEYCRECSGELRRAGSCMVCTNCGLTTGCS